MKPGHLNSLSTACVFLAVIFAIVHWTNVSAYASMQDRVIYLLKHARDNWRCAAVSFRHKVSIRAFNWPSCCTRECRINVAVMQYIRSAPRGLVISTSYLNSSWRLKWLSRTKSNTDGIQTSNYKLVNEAKRSTCRTRGHHKHKRGQILPAHTITGHT